MEETVLPPELPLNRTRRVDGPSGNPRRKMTVTLRDGRIVGHPTRPFRPSLQLRLLLEVVYLGAWPLHLMRKVSHAVDFQSDGRIPWKRDMEASSDLRHWLEHSNLLEVERTVIGLLLKIRRLNDGSRGDEAHRVSARLTNEARAEHHRSDVGVDGVSVAEVRSRSTFGPTKDGWNARLLESELKSSWQRAL